MAKGDETIRRIYDDSVQWLPKYLMQVDASFDYAVFKFPFVPGFHLCLMDGGGAGVELIILSTHKTLHEAMGICKLLLANGGIHRD
jgi:hypothetical protein